MGVQHGYKRSLVYIIGIVFGIKIMIAGMIVNSLIAYYLNSYWSGRLIGYSVKEQLADICAPLMMAAGMGLIAFQAGRIIRGGHLIVLISQVAIGALMVLVFSELVRSKPYLEIKRIVLESIGR